MAIKRYVANFDTIITDAYKADMNKRGTGSNMGASDVLEAFAIYAQQASASLERGRILVNFPVATISSDRTDLKIPASGSVSFFLRLYNLPHGKTLPRNFTLTVAPVSSSWEEGHGMDIEEYTDLTHDGTGSNWINANGTITAATGTITVVANTGSSYDDKNIVITDADGTAKTYTFDDDAAFNTSNIPTIGMSGSSTTTIATNLAAAIKNANGHNGTITVSRDGLVLSLTQATTGLVGNKLITKSIADSQITVAGFGGGGGKWVTEGGDYHTSPRYDVTFDEGTEDLEVDISGLVEQWITGTAGGGLESYGVGLFLTASQESGSQRSYYTKMFSARGTEFFFKRPIIEARWDSSEKDNRGNFYYSSSLAPAADNLNTLYLYNYVRGQLKNIPSIGKGSIYVDLYTGSGAPTNKLKLSPGGGVTTLGYPSTGSWVSTGIYSASMSITAAATPLAKLYDVWHNGSTTTQFFTGTITPVSHSNAVGGLGGHGSMFNPNPSYVTAVTNLRQEYDVNEASTRFRVYTRLKDWNPNIYTVASKETETSIVEDSYFKVFRLTDDLEVIEYGTGSLNETRLSYDQQGSYFDLDMRLLEPGYAYGIKFVYYINDSYREQPEVFKFRVEEKQTQ